MILGTLIGVKMARVSWLLVCLCAAFGVRCGDSASDKTWTSESNLMPLAEGNSWTYSDMGAQNLVRAQQTRVVAGATVFVGKPAWKINEVDEGRARLAYLMRADATGLRVHAFDLYSSKTAERLDLSYPLTVGKSWQSNFQVYDGGHVRVIDWYFHVVGEQTVKVPAGTFHAVCVNANTDLSSPEDTSFMRTWYAPGVGPVRIQLGSTPDAADSVWRLVKYKVK